MKKIWHGLSDAIIHDVHLVIAVVAAGGFIVLEINGLLHGESIDALRGVLLLVMIAVLTLAIDGLKSAKARRETSDYLRRLVAALSDRPILIRERPTEPDHYFYLWDNFTGTYRAYSPAYRVEEATPAKAIVDLYVRRYENAAFTQANYVFLTHDECGKRDLEKFRVLMERVRERVPSCVEKIKVKELAEADADPSAELYIGTRDGKPVAVLELRHPALGQDHGASDYYTVIHDPEIIKSLRNFFDSRWEKAKDVKLFTRTPHPSE